MRKLYLMFLFWAVMGTNAGTLSYHYVNEFKFSRNAGLVAFENADVGKIPGAPALPFKSIKLLLPPDVDMSSVKLAYEATLKNIIENVKVDKSTSRYVNGTDIDIDDSISVIWGKNKFYPSNAIVSYSFGRMRIYNIMEVVFSPFSYNPIDNKLKILRDIDFSISFHTKKAEHKNITVPEVFNSIVKSIICNKDELLEYEKRYPTNREKGHIGVMIPSSLKSSLLGLDDYITAKQREGYKVTVFTEDSWGGPSSSGDADKVREWLASNYEKLGLTHIFIIDDPVDGAIPMKVVCTDFSDRYHPYIDFYYSDLSGNWDVDGDGDFGVFGGMGTNDMAEGGADKYAELFVGRIPYYGNISETNKILERITAYCSEKNDEIEWRKSAFFPMNDFGPGFGDGQKYGSVIKSNVINPAGWELTTLYGSSCSMDKVVNIWNSEPHGLVVWQAHGLYNYAEGVMDNSHAAQLSDKYPPMVWQTSCHNGAPFKSNNLSYEVLLFSAVSTVGAAVQVLYSSNKTEFGVKGGARDYGYIYAKNLVLNKLPAAEAHAKARADLEVMFSTDWLNCVEHNLYGCPATGLFSVAGNVSNGKDVSNKAGFNKAFLEFHALKDKTIFIKNNNTNSRIAKVSVYSLQGKTIRSYSVAPAENEIIFKPNISVGLCIVQVVSYDTKGNEKKISTRMKLGF